MKPIQFEGAHEVGKPKEMTDEQCSSLWARDDDYEFIGPDSVLHQARVWTEVWQPNQHDIEAINAGRPIILQIHSEGLPPVSILTLNENGEPNKE